MIDAYTQTRAEQDMHYDCLDLDATRIVPPLAYQPIPGEECTSPEGIRIFVDRVTEYDCGIVVAGRTIGKHKSKPEGIGHCFVYRFVPIV
jgi:hypothetical protein